MAIILFKNGGYKICDEFSYLHELEAGWSLTKVPPKVDPKIQEQIKKEKEELKKEIPEEEIKVPEEKIEIIEERKKNIIEQLKAKKAELIAKQNKE